MNRNTVHRGNLALAVALLATMLTAGPATAEYKFNDSHFHLTNYIQEGTPIDDYVAIMGDVVKRSTLFGIPLQQMWDYGNTGDFAPWYYLQTDAPLYYYSFTDAYIAMQYLSQPEDVRERLDPMITGFNPADMYAADHIRRVLLTFPGVFTGIGEFTIHKEFVSPKTAGGAASLNDRALDRIFDLCAEVGLVAILHNDIDMPFPKSGQDPYILAQLKDLFRRHQDASIIWAHAGLGRVVRPVEDQIAILTKALDDPELDHVCIDISWDEVAKYVTETPEATRRTADLIRSHPDRFLFGSDCVAPQSIDNQLAVYEMYGPLWDALGPEITRKVCFDNYERLFDAARTKVRAWEKANADEQGPTPKPSPASGYR